MAIFERELSIEYWKSGEKGLIHEFVRKEGVLMTPEGCNWDGTDKANEMNVVPGEVNRIVHSARTRDEKEALFCSRCFYLPN